MKNGEGGGRRLQGRGGGNWDGSRNGVGEGCGRMRVRGMR